MYWEIFYFNYFNTCTLRLLLISCYSQQTHNQYHNSIYYSSLYVSFAHTDCREIIVRLLVIVKIYIEIK